jgi:uncharacterized membrane protein
MRPAKIVAIIIGAVLVLIGFVLFVPGVFLLGAYGAFKDDSGFLQTSTRTASTSGYALVSPDVDLNIGPNGWQWVPTGGRLAVRILASSTDSKDVFIGIGPSDQVAEYLQGVAYDEISEYGWTSSNVGYRHFDGGAPPSPPGDQDLQWDILDGNWTAVIMNADASAAVAVDMSLGAKFGILLAIGIVVTIVGFIFLVAGIVLIVLGARRPRAQIANQPPGGWAPPSGGPGAVPPGFGQQPGSGQPPAGWDTPSPQWQPPVSGAGEPQGTPGVPEQPSPSTSPAEPGTVPDEQEGGGIPG